VYRRIQRGEIMVNNGRFKKTQVKFSFERVGLLIIGVLLFLFAVEYLETETMAESLSAFHWLWH